MAKHLARIHGTEEDKVNCPFYFKIGACRHEDRCSRLHHKPAFSPTILLKHLYKYPPGVVVGSGGGGTATVATTLQNGTNPTCVPALDPRQVYEDFLDFFEDVFLELSKYGRLEGLHVVDNLGDHMIGHVYAKYCDEEDAADALEHLSAHPGRYYDGRLIQVEYSPVTDFREARCRDFDEGSCSRAGFCNFLHVKPVPPSLLHSLETDAEDARVEAEARRRRAQRDHHHHSSSHDRGGGGANSKKRKHEKKERKQHHSSSKRDRHHHHHNSSRSRSYSPRSTSPSPSATAPTSSSMPLPPYVGSMDGLPPSLSHHYPPMPPPGGAGPSSERGGGYGGSARRS